jgi:hypothetical protein
LVMCAFGVCVMCRSADKPSAPLRDAADGASAPAALAISATDKPATDTAGCCQRFGARSDERDRARTDDRPATVPGKERYPCVSKRKPC